MYQAITVPRATPVVTPEQVANFGRFDCPQSSPVSLDYSLLQLFIEAATDQIEIMAQTAMIYETVVETWDCFPGQADPRLLLQFQLSYAYNWVPYWWYGSPTQDSIEVVRRPLVNSSSPVIAPVVTYNDTNGNLQTLDTSTYTVGYSKITLAVADQLFNNWWPLTDRRQDCVQVTFTAGYGSDPSDVPAQLVLAVMYLASHYWENRSIVSVENTSEVYMTLCSLLKPFKSYRIPR